MTLSLSGHGTSQLFLSSELETAVAKRQVSRGAYQGKRDPSQSIEGVHWPCQFLIYNNSNFIDIFRFDYCSPAD
uniref:Uncharacterized protein n=1 Tax=Arundo donax TaxID=35708 RepID=A0A0A9GJ26_ARUDO